MDTESKLSWKKLNRERHNAHNKKYREKNKEKIRQYQSEYRAKKKLEAASTIVNNFVIPMQ